ncbi:helix-turn-helix transcriptional regulator [Stenotrophomonas sp. SY1]|uniref:helix-turn-helix domain-containing protein n=1 Tax=Stenotrophomonas sp. SY1 TaxID=477235 RepID=UPI001E3956DA|nr:helix-turn-helix transcriptional regulator [Stenotrophomonas sp. SY1]
MKARRQAANNGMAAGGRPIRVPRSVNSVRALLRRHLQEEGKRMQELAGAWGCTKQNVYDLFSGQRPFSPNHIDQAARLLGLDEFDTNELRLLGAREAGWAVDPTFLIEQRNG